MGKQALRLFSGPWPSTAQRRKVFCFFFSKKKTLACLTTLPLILGDAIPTPLTNLPGDAARGYAIAANRQLGACTLCHAGPFAAERIPADIAPDLRGIGARLSTAQLRLRVVDPASLNPDTPMPSYRRTEGLVRVDPARAGQQLLTDQQIEDVVAFLSSLTTP